MAQDYPLPRFHFQVDWGGAKISFTEVTGLVMEREKIEYRHSDSKDFSKIAMPGLIKNNNITLKRGKTDDKGWWEWINSIHSGDITGGRRNMSIVLYDYALGEKARYNVMNAWPSKVSISGLKAGGAEVIVEECTLVHEGLEFA